MYNFSFFFLFPFDKKGNFSNIISNIIPRRSNIVWPLMLRDQFDSAFIFISLFKKLRSTLHYRYLIGYSIYDVVIARIVH